VRGNDLTASMSSYLADRILAHAGITVLTATEVTALHGGGHLEAITVHTAAPGDDPSDRNQPCRGLFCFIGATPATGWLKDTPSMTTASCSPAPPGWRVARRDLG
jgi:thioredoxin reductase (NADPH)